MYEEKMMSGPSPRHGNRFSKSPPFLLPGLLVVIVILSFNYWRTSRLNKELLDRVAVSDSHSQKIDYDMKDAAEKSKVLVESLQQALAEEKNNVQTQKDLLEQEKDELSNTVHALNGQLDSMKEEGKSMKETNELLQGEVVQLQEINKKVQSLEETVNNLNESVVSLEAEKLVLLNHVASELGREGVEAVIQEKVHLPDNADFRIPPPDQKALCLKRAEETFLANSANNQQTYNRVDTPIQSPNARAEELGELHRQEEGDQPEDNAANQNQGNPQDTNNQQQLPGGEAAVQGGLNDPNVANQQFVNVANGEEGNAAGGEGQQAAQNIYGQPQGGLPETGQNQEEPNPNKLEQAMNPTETQSLGELRRDTVNNHGAVIQDPDQQPAADQTGEPAADTQPGAAEDTQPLAGDQQLPADQNKEQTQPLVAENTLQQNNMDVNNDLPKRQTATDATDDELLNKKLQTGTPETDQDTPAVKITQDINDRDQQQEEGEKTTLWDDGDDDNDLTKTTPSTP